MIRWSRILRQFDGKSVGVGGTPQMGKWSSQHKMRPAIPGIQEVPSSLPAVRSRDDIEQEASRKASSYRPPIDRQWIKSAASPESTIATRKSWFRVMHSQLLGDSWTPFVDPRTNQPCAAPAAVPVEVRPFTHDMGEEELVGIGGEQLPAFMSPAFRRRRIFEEVRHYDPEVLSLGEVPHSEFRGELGNMIRSLGYGGYFVSSVRTDRGKPLEWGRDPKHKKSGNRMLFEQDVGTAVFFHKGRFFPMLQPGIEFPTHLPYINLSGLRCRISNMQLLIAAVSLTPGSGPAAVEQRWKETLKIRETYSHIEEQGADRAHSGTMVIGNFNNLDIEERCVTQMRKRFSSAYDTVGGPRWTAWYRDAPDGGARTVAAKPLKPEDAKPAVPKRDRPSQRLSSDEIVAQMEEEAALMRREGIHKVTQDFLFYDSGRLSCLNVLDIPDEKAINPVQLLPSAANPSHHVSLVGDFCFNSFQPRDTHAMYPK